MCGKKELKDKFYTIAIDTVDQAWQLVDRYICSLEGVENLSDIGYGKLYKKKLDEFMGTFRDLSYEGYGIIFTSHASEKICRNERGEEYIKTVPSLPASGANNPFDAINKFVDIIGYIQQEKNEDGHGDRYLCLRGTDNYLAGSRLAHMPDKIELSYDKLVEAVYDAVDEEVKNSGGKATNERNPYSIETFDELMDEAKRLWNKGTEQEKNEEILKILEDEFERPIKFSEVKENEKEKLKAAISKIRSMF